MVVQKDGLCGEGATYFCREGGGASLLQREGRGWTAAGSEGGRKMTREGGSGGVPEQSSDGRGVRGAVKLQAGIGWPSACGPRQPALCHCRLPYIHTDARQVRSSQAASRGGGGPRQAGLGRERARARASRAALQPSPDGALLAVLCCAVDGSPRPHLLPICLGVCRRQLPLCEAARGLRAVWCCRHATRHTFVARRLGGAAARLGRPVRTALALVHPVLAGFVVVLGL